MHVLLVTNRPALYDFFCGLAQGERRHFAVSQRPLAVNVEGRWPQGEMGTRIAVIDVTPDVVAAIAVCEALRAQQPGLPLVAWLCCPVRLEPGHLRELVAAGVGSVLDSHASSEQLRGALHRAASGYAVVHLHLGREQGGALREQGGALEPRREARAAPALRAGDAELLNLVAHGLSDQEIGAAVHRSRHTARHDLERLREAVGARNRIELASWAGRHGYYRPGPAGDPGDRPS